MPEEATRPPRAERRPRTRRPTERMDASPAPEPKSEKKRTPADRKLAANIAGMYQGIGAVVVGVGMQRDDRGIYQSGVKTIELSEPISEAWLDLCDSNPKVRQALVRMTEVSTVGVLVSLHMTVALPVLVSRGIVPQAFAGVANANSNGGNSSSGDN